MIAPATHRYDIKQGRTIKAPTIPESLLPAAEAASGYYVCNDGKTVSFAVYGQSSRSRQVKAVVAAIEAAGYVVGKIHAPQVVGLHCADGRSPIGGSVTAIPV